MDVTFNIEHCHVSFSSLQPLKQTFILAYLNSKKTHIYSAVCHSRMCHTFTIISLTTHSPPAKHTCTHTIQLSCSTELCQILLTASGSLSLQLPWFLPLQLHSVSQYSGNKESPAKLLAQHVFKIQITEKTRTQCGYRQEASEWSGSLCFLTMKANHDQVSKLAPKNMYRTNTWQM